MVAAASRPIATTILDAILDMLYAECHKTKSIESFEGSQNYNDFCLVYAALYIWEESDLLVCG